MIEDLLAYGILFVFLLGIMLILIGFGMVIQLFVERIR